MVNATRFLILFLAILSFSVGNLLFAAPNHIMNGGVTGLSLMTHYVLGQNIGLNLFLYNVPLFVAAFFYYRQLFYKSVISMILFSIIVGVLQDFLIPLGVRNIWLGSMVGGFWMGLSLGVLAKMNASLGGGSLLGKMIHERYGYSLSKSIFIVDSSVYPISLFVIGPKETLFSLILTASSALGVYAVGLLLELVQKKRPVTYEAIKRVLASSR